MSTLHPLLKAAAKVTELYLYDFIGMPGAGISHKDVVSALAQVRGPLLVRINSPGGDIGQGVGIYNALDEYASTKGAVNVQIDSEASSIAAYIAMVGDKVRMAKNATLMIHKGWTFTAGNADDHTATAAILDRSDKEQQAPAFARKTGKMHGEVMKLLAAESWFTADEALRDGFVDEIGLASDVTPRSASAAQFRLAAQRGPARSSEPRRSHAAYLSAEYVRRLARSPGAF